MRLHLYNLPISPCAHKRLRPGEGGRRNSKKLEPTALPAANRKAVLVGEHGEGVPQPAEETKSISHCEPTGLPDGSLSRGKHTGQQEWLRRASATGVGLLDRAPRASLPHPSSAWSSSQGPECLCPSPVSREQMLLCPVLLGEKTDAQMMALIHQGYCYITCKWEVRAASQSKGSLSWSGKNSSPPRRKGILMESKQQTHPRVCLALSHLTPTTTLCLSFTGESSEPQK